MAAFFHPRPVFALLLLVLSAVALLAACSSEETAVPIDLTIREEVAMPPEADQVLTYAYLPQFSHTVSFQRHHLLIRYLDATCLQLSEVLYLKKGNIHCRFSRMRIQRVTTLLSNVQRHGRYAFRRPVHADVSQFCLSIKGIVPFSSFFIPFI